MNRECHGDHFTVSGIEGLFYRCLLDSAIVRIDNSPETCPNCGREIDYGSDREIATVVKAVMVRIPGSGVFDFPFSVQSGRDEYIERVTKHIVPADDATAHESMTLEGIYGGGSKRIHEMLRTAYRRGVRRGAACAWSAHQKIKVRSGKTS